MTKAKYDISIIMPIYNMEKYIESAINSVINQDYEFSKIQIVLINDGSTDKSQEIIERYAKEFTNVTVINQENQGLAKTRNNGIKASEGKYILFLDPDDTISHNTVSSIVNFFDKNYDEIDLVSYKIIPVVNGEKKKGLHYRYNILTKTGIYDLTKGRNIYSCITTINYCVKNRFENNILFDETPNFRHEDQKFACDIIRAKLKIGYVDEAEYYYLQQSGSITHTYFYAYYIFDEATRFWENLFGQYKKDVPKYFQALFISDIKWKIKSDILKPYYLEGKEFNKQYNRIINLLNRVDNDVILNHPVLNDIYKYHFINSKNNKKLKLIYGNNISYISIVDNDQLIYSTDKIKLYVARFNIYEDYIDVIGYLVDPSFDFFKKPKLYLKDLYDQNNDYEIPLRESSFSYYQAKEKTTKAWLFETKIDTSKISSFSFNVNMGTASLNCELIFKETTPFNVTIPERNKIFKFNKKYIVDYKENKIDVIESNKKEEKMHNKILNNYYFYSDFKRWISRKILMVGKAFVKKNIWLYYDCKGVEKDNAYYQFLHDIKIKDGIKRYYVSANDRKINNKIFNSEQRKMVISFKGFKHKLYYCSAQKILTAFIENNNCSPYTNKSYNNYSDIFQKPEVIYLQHGVLHAHTPWKYSFDRFLIDKEVISTNYERKNLIENYAFTEEHLIDAGMPRYDFISQTNKPKNKILFAPSWRNYLISNIKGNWQATDKKFKDSVFFEETYKFLTSKKLHEVLEKYDFTLDFKLHPIFKCYEKFYKIKSDRINIGSSTSDNADYSIFVTDYSSFVFDFVYLKRAIIYFFPDYDMFKAGLNIYRELDLPFEKGFGKLIENSDEMIKHIEKLLKNNCTNNKLYMDRTNGFFIHNDDSQRDRIYEAISK